MKKDNQLSGREDMIMKTQKTTRNIIILATFFFLSIKKSYAFLAPSSLQLLASSIGPWIQYIIVIAITAIVSFNLKIKKKKKKLMIIFLILFQILLISSLINYYKDNNCSSCNIPEEVVFLYNWEGFDRIDNKNRYVNLNKLTINEYDEFEKINLLPIPKLNLKDSKHLSMFFLRELLRFDLEPDDVNFDTFFEYNFNITKNGKLLLYCYSCWTSKAFSYYLNKKGYNTYYSCFKDIKKVDYLDIDIIKKSEVPVEIKNNQLPESKTYIYFLLGTEEGKFSDKLCSKTKLVKTQLYSAFLNGCQENKIYEDHNYDWHDIDSYEIICGSPVHCLLSSHYIGYLNLTSYKKVVYSIY